MTMECPNCGAENPDYAVYCGKCAGSIKEPEKSTGSPENSLESVSITQMEPLIQNDLVRTITIIGGIITMIFGALSAILGAYGMRGGNVQFTVNDKLLSTEEGGELFLTIGLVVVVVGYGVIYAARYKRKAAQAD